MAFRGGMRRALNEVGLWLAFAGAGAASFYYFEDAYRLVEQSWPGLQASVTRDMKRGIAAVDTTASVSASRQTHEAGQTVDELRSSLTGLDDIIARTTVPNRSVTLDANAYGHFIVEAEINGGKVDLLTDTGATYVALSYETALQLGFTKESLRFDSRSSTANGIAQVAPVNLDYIRVGSIVLRDVKAVVAEPGKMSQNLLGMSFISRLGGFELRRSRLLMVQQPSSTP